MSELAPATSRPATPPEPEGGPPPADPLAVLKSFTSLRALTGMYPARHPMIAQKLRELEDLVQTHLELRPTLQIDIIRGEVHVDSLAFRLDGHGNAQVLAELADLGVDSLHIHRGVESRELLGVAEFLWQFKERAAGDSIEAQLAGRHIFHVSLGKIVPLDTRWQSQKWPDAPPGPLDPAYAESLRLAEETFTNVTAGRRLDTATVRGLVQLLMYKVAHSSAALGQILTVKQYENLTYCHSVNVAMLSFMLGRKLKFDEPTMGVLVEAALLHDIGKTRIPLEVVKKPGALNKRERKLVEGHTVLGAEILAEIDELKPLTPTVALEHHRTIKGGGYPDLGEGVVPHRLSQVVSVADVYEAVTGARSYRDPILPEQACLLLARLAGRILNTALVKAFINVVTFFPVGSVVRTSRDEIGVVVRTNPADPLHPIIALLDLRFELTQREIDTSARDASGVYDRHIAETINPPEGRLDLTRLLPTAIA
jgi:putative nucleotidyltransferase with HDIG domain